MRFNKGVPQNGAPFFYLCIVNYKEQYYDSIRII